MTESLQICWTVGPMPNAPMPDSVYLLRHGETDLNAQGVLQGSIEAPLNTLGRAQAAQAAERLVGLGVKSILSSPQLRARQTAVAVAKRLSLRVIEEPTLRERAWGVFEGKLRNERDDRGEGVEPFAALQQRAQSSFLTLIGSFPLPFVVVTHSGFIKALLSQMNAKSIKVIRNGEIIVLSQAQSSSSRPQCEKLLGR